MSGATILLVFLEGLLAFISPCILPMLPVYFLYLSGESVKEAGAEIKQSGIGDTVLMPSGIDAAQLKQSGIGDTGIRKPGKMKLVINTLFFILGFTAVFLMLGATSTVIGQVLSGQRVFWERASGVIIILLGIHMTGLIRIPLLNREHRMSSGSRTKSLLSSLLLGIAFSFGWSPCLGPFLGSALLLSGQSSTLWEGMLLLFVFSLGLAVPFLLASLLFEELTQVFSWLKKHMLLIRILSGSLLIVLGLLMLLGWFGYYALLYS